MRSGGSGTSFSGGSGGGGYIRTSTLGMGTAGAANGGAGGKGYSSTSQPTKLYGGSGAGNPGGTNLNTSTVGQASSGTGGLLILIVDGDINITGSITSNGANGGQTLSIYKDGQYSSGGGGSGGGAIHLFYKGTLTGQNKISAAGGRGGLKTTSNSIYEYNGFDGGAGSINLVSIN